jgi:hypothetical protein
MGKMSEIIIDSPNSLFDLKQVECKPELWQPMSVALNRALLKGHRLISQAYWLQSNGDRRERF